MFRKSSFILLLFSFSQWLPAQNNRTVFWQPSDSVCHRKVMTAGLTTAGLYAGSMIGLSQLWYKGYDQTSFHFFNDFGEWEHMDKLGHLMATYQESYVLSQFWRWTGVSRQQAALYATASAYAFQTTIDILDGFSAKWGFSLPDIASNTLGAAAFLTQELWFQQQIMTLKISCSYAKYPDTRVISLDGTHSMTLQERAADLYGQGFFHRSLKDYNGQTYWLSFNLHTIAGHESPIPQWLNLAIGYGAQNMYSGYDNTWLKDGAHYALNHEAFPRYRQFYLSLDADFLKLGFKRQGPRSLACLFNFIKVPSPSLEFNTLGEVKFKLLYF